MSSGASVAYEKPRSGRSICIDETPMSSRIASALMSFAASWLRTIAKSPRRKRTSTPALALKRSKCGLTLGSRSIATSLPLPCEILREQAGMAAGAERGVDDRLAGLHGEQAAHLVREDGGVIRRAVRQDVGQHCPRSLRSPPGAPPRAERSQISRWSLLPIKVTSLPSFPCATSGAGRCTRPCLSGTSSEAPPKKWRCSSRVSGRSGSSSPMRATTVISHRSRG